MAQVYLIKNIINEKEYVGKTTGNYKTRWKEHVRESKQERASSRPLYRAINKYGIDSFEILLLHDNLNEEEACLLEIEEIEDRGTFGNGYNATAGGDGTTYRLVGREDIENIIYLYQEEKMSIEQIAELYFCDSSTASRRLKEHGVKTTTSRGEEVGMMFAKHKNNDDKIYFNNIEECISFISSKKLTEASDSRIREGIRRVLLKTRKSYLGYYFEAITKN